MNKSQASWLAGLTLVVASFGAQALTITQDIGMAGFSASITDTQVTLGAQNVVSGQIDGTTSLIGGSASTASPFSLPFTAPIYNFWTVTKDGVTYDFDLTSIISSNDSGTSGSTRTISLNALGDFGNGSESTTANFGLTLVLTKANPNIDTWKGLTTNLTVQAVPIPAAGWLFGSALFGVGTIAARRNRQKTPA